MIRALPADVHTSLADDIGRLTQPISPWWVAALTAFAMLVTTMAAAATAGLSAALLPQLGQLNIAAGLTLAALLLPGYVRHFVQKEAVEICGIKGKPSGIEINDRSFPSFYTAVQRANVAKLRRRWLGASAAPVPERPLLYQVGTTLRRILGL